MINFIINNYSHLLGLTALTIIFSAIFTAIYFLLYKYLINRRLQSPEKKQRFGLIAPRYMAIVIVILTFIGAYKIPSYESWRTEYAYIEAFSASDAGEFDFDAPDKLRNNPDFGGKIAETETEGLNWSVFFNKNFSGVINPNDKSGCEFIVTAEPTSKIAGDYAGLSVVFLKGDYKYGVGVTDEINKGLPAVFYCWSDSYDRLSLETQFYSKKDYKRMTRDEENEVDGIIETDYAFKKSSVILDLSKREFTADYSSGDVQKCCDAANSLLGQLAQGVDYDGLDKSLRGIISRNNYDKMNFRKKAQDAGESYTWSYPEGIVDDDGVTVNYTVSRKASSTAEKYYVDFVQKDGMFKLESVAKE